MNLLKGSGEWSDELVADAAKLGVPPNLHPMVKALPPAPYVPAPVPAPAAAAVADVPADVTPAKVS